MRASQRNRLQWHLGGLVALAVALGVGLGLALGPWPTAIMAAGLALLWSCFAMPRYVRKLREGRLSGE